MRRLARVLVVVALVAVWFVTLRPAPLGGPASVVVVSGNSMLPGLKPGTLVLGHRRSSYDVGDVIVYRVPRGEPGAGTRVIHRVVGGSAAEGYRTRGDNRKAPDRWRPRPRDIEGVKLVAVPGAGRALRLLASPMVLGGMLAAIVFLSFDGMAVPRRRRACAGPVVAMWPPMPAVRPQEPAVSEAPRPAPCRPRTVVRRRRRSPSARRLAVAGGVLGAGLVASRLARRV